MRSMSSPLTPARSTAAFTAVAPRSVAEASASAPCIEPIGVRAIERMTVGSSAMVAMDLLRSRNVAAHIRLMRRLFKRASRDVGQVAACAIGPVGHCACYMRLGLSGLALIAAAATFAVSVAVAQNLPPPSAALQPAFAV